MKRIIVCISVLILLASCGGHRKAVKPSPDTSYEELQPDFTSGKDLPGERIVSQARRWLGTPYRYGGETRQGTDCSGMVMVLYRDVAGIKIPRNSGKQQEFCKHIQRSELNPGDLVFFSSSRKGRVSHVGIYAGRDKFIHASSSQGVIISSLDEDYYRRHFHSAGRVPGVFSKSVTEQKEPELLQPRPFHLETVDRMPGRKTPVVEKETVRIVEVRVDTVYVPSPTSEEPDSIISEVKNAF